MSSTALTATTSTSAASTTVNSSKTLFYLPNPEIFQPNKNEWFFWKIRLEAYFTLTNCHEDSAKNTILLQSLGSGAFNLLNALCSPSAPMTKTYEELCKLLDTLYTPVTNVLCERKTFYGSSKLEDEKVIEWFVRLKGLALNCKFGEHLDAIVLDQFILGLPDEIFERLCEEEEALTLSYALDRARFLETIFAFRTSESTGANNRKKSTSRANNKYRTNNNRRQQ